MKIWSVYLILLLSTGSLSSQEYNLRSQYQLQIDSIKESFEPMIGYEFLNNITIPFKQTYKAKLKHDLYLNRIRGLPSNFLIEEGKELIIYGMSISLGNLHIKLPGKDSIYYFPVNDLSWLHKIQNSKRLDKEMLTLSTNVVTIMDDWINLIIMIANQDCSLLQQEIDPFEDIEISKIGSTIGYKTSTLSNEVDKGVEFTLTKLGERYYIKFNIIKNANELDIDLGCSVKSESYCYFKFTDGTKLKQLHSEDIDCAEGIIIDITDDLSVFSEKQLDLIRFSLSKKMYDITVDDRFKDIFRLKLECVIDK